MEENRDERTEQEEIKCNDAGCETCEEAAETVVTGCQEDEKERQIAELTAKLAESQDRYLRLSAEFDNYRKRTLKEKAELIKTAGEDILKSMIPVVDDFDRAIYSMNTATSVDSIQRGTYLIYNKLIAALESKGLSEMNPLGDHFNSEIHEAIAKVRRTDEQGDRIIDVTEKGYTLNGKIIRYPKVVIGE
jgi:molecular chaperone GrpE